MEKKKIKLTLNKANNILQKMNLLLSDVSPRQLYTSTIVGMASASFQPSTSVDEVFEYFKLQKDEYVEKSILLLNGLNDYYSLKAKIFKINAEFGLNDILNTIDKLKTILRIQESILRSIVYPKIRDFSELTRDWVNEIKEYYSSKDDIAEFQISIRYENVEDVKQSINSLKKQINELEDEKTKLNATDVEIELTETTMEYLGL